jgi:energy-coupling factor transporter transmembrane protein EcfT
MRTFWHDMWGCGRGPVVRLAPQTRILAAALLFAACLAAPAGTVPGILLVAATTLVWAAACGAPRRVLLSFTLLGLAMFLPYFLLVPLLMERASSGPAGAGLIRGLAAPWDVFLHGLAGMLLAAATVTGLNLSDLRRGLLALPVPGVFAAVLIQIVHQTSELFSETRRVADAVAVRSAAGRSRAALRLLASLPRVWLPRMVGRADRVAAAMELRGYAEADLRVFGGTAARAADVATIVSAGGVLVLAAALRWRWIG